MQETHSTELRESVSTESQPIGMISSREFRGLADTASGKRNTISQNIWLQLRSPFLLPPHTCVKCTNWEAIEYGKMGCKTCSAFHICSVSTCPLSEIENNHVCVITGVVVKTITYDVNEYMSTATRETPSTSEVMTALIQNKKTKTSETPQGDFVSKKKAKCESIVHSMNTKRHTVSQCINFHQRVCMEVLCSETTTQCYEKERTKLRNRLRWSFMKNVRAFKMQRGDKAPNVIILASRIAADVENYRLPLMNDTSTLRKNLAQACAHAILKFTCSMTVSKAQFTMNLDAKTMIIGLLYLLRSGLVHRSITILPQFRSLSYLLPPENYINLFGVKSKIITETENIVKCHLRTLADSQIKDIGYEAFDRLVH